jgi:hypothetical protein
VIGFLGTTTPVAWSQWTAAFVQRLRELGWIEGRTITIEYRWAEGHPERYAEIATEFVRLPVDIIVTTVPAVSALKVATSVIPVVFALATDPVGGGLIASLARPGGNVTGLSMQATDLASKRARRDAVGVVAQKGLPALRRWPPSPGHVFCHRGLPDIDAKLEQFAVDPWRSPKRVRDAHVANELANVGRCLIPIR